MARFLLLLVLLVTTALVLAQEKTKPYRSEEHGVVFEIPNDWKVSKNKDRTRFEITMTGTKERAIADLYSTDFRQTADDWLQLEKTANTQLKRTVERQWTEELLGVPLLMTRIRYTMNGQDLTAVTGLMYSANKNKFHFRLTSPTSRFDEVQESWKGALLTMRTLTGAMPKVDNPDNPLPVQPKITVPKNVRPPFVIKSDEEQKRATKNRGPVKVPCTVSERNLILSMPKGFVAKLEGTNWVITNPKLRGSVMLDVNAILDSPRPERALNNRAGVSLEEFTKVDKRRDRSPWFSTCGSKVSTVLRQGSNATGPLVILHAVGDCGDYYWALVYRSAKLDDLKFDEPILETLFDWLRLDPATP